MRPLYIALKDLRIVTRDFKALAVIIAMPIVLVMILGAALGPMFTRMDRVNPFGVAVVDLDKGQMSRLFMDLLASGRLKSLISPLTAESEEAARALIDEGRVACAVIIPKGTGALSGTSASSFKVLGDPDNAVKSEVMKAIVESFAQQYSVVTAGTFAVLEEISRAGHPPQGVWTLPPGGWESIVPGIVESLAEETTKSTAVFAETREDRGWITAVQYYAAGMTVMFMMFGAMLGAKSIIEERGMGTLVRLFSTRATPTDLMVGKTLAAFLVSYLQILVLVLFTRYAFRISWGPSLLNVAVVSAALALAATGFAMLIAAVARTEKRVDAFENIGVQVMAFVGGCQYPIYGFPKPLQAVSKMAFTRWGLEAYLGLMDGQGLSAVAVPVLIVAGMGLGFLAIGIWRLRLE